MKIKYLIICAIAFSFMACENQENEFDDFGSTSVYFPFQTPIRTLIQGKYDLGFNENDNNGRFEIGVIMSGVYNNEKNRRVHFELAPELIDAAALGLDTVNVKVLPSSYYTIEQESPVTIPSGSTKGRIPVQLSDVFFDDPQSFADFGEVHYVLPLRITDYEELDSLLVGVPAEGVTNPIKIKADDWETQPKDYTLFGIKFMNKYQGVYLRRGEDEAVGSNESVTVYTNGSPIETESESIEGSTVYRSEFVVGDELLPVLTAGRNEVITTINIRRPGIATNSTLDLLLTFNDNEDVTVTNADPDSTISVTGTGKFVEDGDAWGGETRDVIYLDYQYRELEVEVTENRFFGTLLSTKTSTFDLLHTVKDTLVIRDRDVKFEEFTIETTNE
ncbi:DUF1735 domain-containing protein [Algibacter amylolyticus]|uniref:DUF1735 domain-containing protein n=1 Tax=Algibacter amylolyticus TaxID=1608400 RepID=A0A5M7BCK7_9FLAO|nr:DUF5627 domain-containing protein [Algibacter amylolyticus]KAA5824855.1 DUF1735 domain-containing protein [Algibacter amylolyticus]MBB5268982.1 hypothetical protein [Algibacter amylolyticus]TSJ76020.1 DUF1735 domain-containing protein [Algibacter amylolyticus]